jgi:hypothetical protein
VPASGTCVIPLLALATEPTDAKTAARQIPSASDARTDDFFKAPSPWNLLLSYDPYLRRKPPSLAPPAAHIDPHMSMWQPPGSETQRIARVRPEIPPDVWLKITTR